MRRRMRSARIVAPLSVFVVSLRTAQTIYEVADGQTAVLTVPVDRNGNMGYVGSVQWAVSGTGPTPATVADFGGTYQSDFIYFGANDLTVNIQITITGNNAVDGDRHFTVSLNAPSTTGGSGVAAIATQSIICTIIDDDAALPTTSVTYNGDDTYYNGDPVEL